MKKLPVCWYYKTRGSPYQCVNDTGDGDYCTKLFEGSGFWCPVHQCTDNPAGKINTAFLYGNKK
jgi:hypothetical protein